MKHLIINILILFQFNLSYAQLSEPQDLVRRYSDTLLGAATPRQIIAASDGGFFIAGALDGEGLLLKLTPCGDLAWAEKYLLGAETKLSGVAELPDGRLAAVGDCVACAAGDSSTKALVLLTSANGQLLKDTTLGRANFDASAAAVILTRDGKLAVTGSFVWATFLHPRNAFLAVLDEQLLLAVWAEYHHFYYDYATALTQTVDGGFALAGYSSPQLFAPSQAQLFRTNAQGQLLWKTTSSHLNSRFNAIQPAPDGRIVAFGQRMIVNGQKQDAYLAAHNSVSGVLILEKTYGGAEDDSGFSLQVVDGGYLAAGQWGTPSQTNHGLRDWVFRLDEDFVVEEEFFRDSYLFSHFLVNTLPLSPDGRDFAFLSHRFFFSSHDNVFFKRSFRGHRLQLTEAPQHYQLYPRNLATNNGLVEYQGSLATPGAYDEVRLKVYRNDGLVQTISDHSPAALNLQFNLPAELADYRFQLLGVKNGVPYSEAEACDVVAGDAYLIQGQSNAVAGLPYDLADTVAHVYDYIDAPFVRNFGLKSVDDTTYVWRREADDDGDYADNRSGQWGLLLASQIAAAEGVPVAIVNGGINGISIDSMLPHPLDRTDTSRSYGRFLRRVQRSGLIDHLRAIIMFQGETNAAGNFWDSTVKYQMKFAQLAYAWRQDFPALERRYLFQIRPGAYFAGATLLTCLRISEAQRRIAEQSDWQIMSSTGMNHDGIHYYYDNGYERAGQDIFRLIHHDLYDAPYLANSHPPTVDSAWFSGADRREITLRLRHEEDNYQWTPGWEADFRLEGSTGVSVTTGLIEGHTVVLSLSDAPTSGFSGLSYTSHPGGSEASVKNANGIGLLTMYNFPVSEPMISLSAQDPLIEGVGIFPNPCSDFLHLQAPILSSEPMVWEIYDGQGRLLRQLPADGQAMTRLRVTDWAAGLYFVRLRYAGINWSFKLVKQ